MGRTAGPDTSLETRGMIQLHNYYCNKYKLIMNNSEELISFKTKQRLEELLQDLGVHTFEIKVTAGTTNGENFLGIIAKVKVTGKDIQGDDVIRNFVIKSAPLNKMIRSILPINIAYQREAYMYNVVLPEFNRLQTEKNILKPFMSFAKHYKSFLYDQEEAIILEDMQSHGFYSVINQKESINYEHAVFILKEYGKFHALSFAMRLHKPDLFEEIAKNTQERYFQNFKKNFRDENYKNYSLKAFASLDCVKDKELYDRYSKFHDRIDKIAVQMTDSDFTNSYNVVRHGDCWIKNFLFKYQNDEYCVTPKEICFLDWQMACFGSPALDLSYFIFSNTDKNLRDKYYDKLLEEYHDSFRSFLKEFGGDADKQFSFDMLKAQMKKYGIYGLIWSTIILFVCTNNSDDIPNIELSSNPDDIFSMQSSDLNHLQRYQSRIRDVITDLIYLGLSNKCKVSDGPFEKTCHT
ncbi:hypothetical protein RN001_012086 [Aquatica leii]|uniref:CHK kinase-like domain-containing protein n=1 Tax=Aquatica leii TaxID=1421715 RepID=A0AAN7P2I5_9COLE|nr:hypothetical protein RN001_012086 [Aquatica leii]